MLNRGLKVMDSTAITLCMDNRLPICVFDLMGENLAGAARRRAHRHRRLLTRVRGPVAAVAPARPWLPMRRR